LRALRSDSISTADIVRKALRRRETRNLAKEASSYVGPSFIFLKFIPWKCLAVYVDARSNIFQPSKEEYRMVLVDLVGKTFGRDSTKAGDTMGQRTLRINTRFLPVLMGRGIHHYSVFRNALPEDCCVVDASVTIRESGGDSELVLLLESSEWEPSNGAAAPEIMPSFVRHYCPRVGN
jgi:hypothetical protein